MGNVGSLEGPLDTYVLALEYFVMGTHARPAEGRSPIQDVLSHGLVLCSCTVKHQWRQSLASTLWLCEGRPASECSGGVAPGSVGSAIVS